MKNLTQLLGSGKGSKAKNDNTLGRMRGGIRSKIGSMSLKNTSLFGVILALLLTLGVGEMWGADVQQNAIIYMNNSAAGWDYSNIYFVINSTNGYPMTAVANTKLYVHKRSAGTWSGYSDVRFFAATGSWGGDDASMGSESNMASHGANLTNTQTNYGFNGDNYYVIKLDKAGDKTSSSTRANLSTSWIGNAYTSMNKTMTVKAKISTDGGSSYSAGNTPGKLTASSYTFTAYNSCASATSATVNAGSASNTISVGYTANLTLTAVDVEGYDFIGWSSGTNASTNIGTTKSVTVNPTAATTYYAWYREKCYAIKVLEATPSGSGSSPSPSSFTATGQITGGSISVTANTGYDFSGWTIYSGSGTFANASSTSTTFYPTADSELRPNFTAKTITVTLDGNEGTDGSATVKYNAISLTSITHASRAGYSLKGYYTAASGGSKVINADGSLNNVSGWVSGGYWNKATNGTLYAQWTEDITNYTVTYAVKSDQTSLGTLSCAKTFGGAAVSSGSTVASGTGVTFTASPITGYEVDAWFSNPACTTPIAGAGYANTYATSVTADLGVYVKFKKKIYTITYSPSSAPTGCTYTTKPTTGTYGNPVTMVITPSTGYTVSVSARDASSNVVTISNPSANTYTFTQPASAVTVTVSTSQIMSTLTTSNSYDVGDPSYSVPNKTASSIGISTTATLTATAPGTGYTFAGWTLSNNLVITSGDAATDLSITVRTNGNGEAATAQANYKEDLSSRWHLVGSDVANKVTFPNGWTVDASSMMHKVTGHSTESVVYANVTVSNAAGTYEFKVVDDNGAGDDIWYGYSTGETYLTWEGTDTKKVYTGDGNGNNLRFTPTITGTYQFKVDYSGTYPAVTITYPTPYIVTYSVSPDGAGGAITTSPSVSSGGKIAAGTNVTFTYGEANAGYEWYRWEDGSGSELGIGSTYTTSITANTTVVAKYRAKTYTITLDKQTGATGYGSSGTAANPTATYNEVLPAISGTMPAGTGSYNFMGFYTGTLGTGLRLTDASGTWIASVEGYTDADKKWIHAGDVTLYAYYKQAEISELTPDPAIIAPGETVTVTPTLLPAPAGTHIICWELQYSNGTALPSQPTFTPGAGNAVRFPAPEASATYRIQATLRSGNDCGGGSVLSTRAATFQVAGEHVVTILYQDGDGRTLAASTEIEARPLEWTTLGDITPPAITGYTFVRWDAGDGVSIKNGEDDPVTTITTSSIQIKATYDGTLKAVYNKKKMIFFNNTLGWSDVYVYFYNTDKYWSGEYGSGAQKNQAFDGDSKPYWEEEHGRMTQIEGTNVWYFDYTETGYPTRANVVFTEADQHGNQWFYKTKAVRSGGHTSSLPMFVPINEKSVTKNETDYYNHGYWMNYPENTGYTLKIYNQKATAGAVELRSVPFAYSADLIMPLEVKVDLEAGRTYGFKIYRADGTTYGNTGTMTANTMNLEMTSNAASNCGLTTTAAGDYTFNLYYSDYNENGDYQYRVDVTYPVAANDYRIVYSDLAAWSGATHTAAWIHPSRVITKNSGSEAKQDTVSFFWAYGSSPALKYQTCTEVGTGSATWSAGTAISVSSFSSVLTETGVYNFIFEQPAGGASISLVKVEPYNGKYYIRTDCAGATKWANYRTMDHEMTYSDYAETNSGFSHYFAHWVTSGTNVKFTIANDYSPCVSDTLTADYGTVVANINAGGDLVSGNANIRFMWNQSTNKLSRAYISGSGYIADRFLVLEGNEKMYDENGKALTTAGGGKISGLNDNEMNLIDNENFVYERTIQVNTQARARLSAAYNGKTQYFIGSSGDFEEGTTVELLGGEISQTKYTMRIVYDFKTNRLVTAYMPSNEAISEPLAINADIMLVREHQNAGQQLTFEGNGSLSKVKTVYGVMRFNRWTLNNKEKTGEHSPVGDPKSTYERSLYWISFPFDVNLSDVFGFGTYGTHWIIEYYDGAERATEGYWADSEGFWKYVTNRNGYKLEAGKGYILALDLDLMRDNNTSFWANNIEQVELFFPSAAAVENIKKTNTEIDIPAHECTIAARPGMSDDRRKKDSHWNIIGVPSYANYGSELKDSSNVTITWNDNPATKNMPFLYEWNMVDNTYSVQSGTTYPFKSMHAYMVQYNGKLKWLLASATPVSPVIARQTDAPKDVEFRIELQQGEATADQTFVKMSTDEQISTAFDFNYDLSKQMNSGKANIYTMVEGYIQTAGNCLPMSEQTTVVPVGVKIAADGDYTFAIPEGTAGIGVTMIDTETGIRTNLSALTYTIALTAGTYDNRFVLEFSPIRNVPTEQPDVRSQKSEVSKVLIDGLLYIVRDNKMYDARGAMIMEK